MSNNDRSNGDERRFIKALAEMSFPELARAHDTAIRKSLDHYEAMDMADAEGKRYSSTSEMAAGRHESRMADIIKSVLLFRFPEASDAWFE